ncbi:11883_t:CDS:2 [Ambispora gerdemannii]|uniref:11883_t:CDS:1 n=1 Tax=Ambispora gerdemannii TaxID=144530 RepID=A0A9N9GQR5_9GLOM|nr:11883_t:CDS:2 [Ambispora gerdemannii]
MSILDDSDIIQAFKVKAPISLTYDDQLYESVAIEVKIQGRRFRKLLNRSYLNSKRSSNVASEIIDYIHEINSVNLPDTEKKRVFYKLKNSCSRIVDECKNLSNEYEEITKSLANIYEQLRTAQRKKIESYAPDYPNDPFYKLHLLFINKLHLFINKLQLFIVENVPFLSYAIQFYKKQSSSIDLRSRYEAITKSLAKIYEQLHAAQRKIIEYIAKYHRSSVFSRLSKIIDLLGQIYAPDYPNDPFYEQQLIIVERVTSLSCITHFYKKLSTSTDLGSRSGNSSDALLVINKSTSTGFESRSENSFDALLSIKKLQDNLDIIVQLVKDFENYWVTIDKQINKTSNIKRHYASIDRLTKNLDQEEVNLIIEEWETLHHLFESYATDINKVLDHTL